MMLMYIKTCGIYSRLYVNITTVCKSLVSYCVNMCTNDDNIILQYTSNSGNSGNSGNNDDDLQYNNCTCDCLYNDSNYNNLCVVQNVNYVYPFISLLIVMFLVCCCYICYIFTCTTTSRYITNDNDNYINPVDNMNANNNYTNYVNSNYLANQYYLDTQNTSILPNYVEVDHTNQLTSNSSTYVYDIGELPQYNFKSEQEEFENLQQPPEYNYTGK